MRALLILLGLAVWAAPLDGPAQQRAGAAPEAGESRIALVIGNANYKDAPLANPVNDARAIAKALNELGFQVKVQTNLSQAQMRRAIREFGDELHARQGVGLFYFAGHGVQISNRNFLIPVGADIQREYEVEDQAVDAGAVLSMMQTAKARVNIVILDACRNNPFIRDFRSTINGLAPMQAPAGTLVAFSTAPGQTAIDGTGQYGLYTEHLLENLTVPGLKIEDVFKNVRVSVQRSSSGRQVPWENTSLTGDFYFRAGSPAQDAAGRTQQAEIDQAVRQALRQREQEEAARRRDQQEEIERAVTAALRKREQEQGARAQQQDPSSKAAIDRLNSELAELRAAREAERKAATEPKPAASAPAQVALAAPTAPRREPAIKVGGRVERPDVRVGDQWKYHVTDAFTREKNIALVEVATVTENRIYTRSSLASVASLGLAATAGAIEVWDRDWNQLRQGENEFAPFYPSFQFPLEAGKRWSGSVQFRVAPGRVNQQMTAQVAGWERVTVPAGTFDAVRIELRGNYSLMDPAPTTYGQSNGALTHTVWYAPAVRQVVKKQMHQTDFSRDGGQQVDERWELIEYRSASQP